MTESVSVQVVYALPSAQALVQLSLPSGSTVAHAIRASGLLERHPEIDPAVSKVGIFGKQCPPDTVLRDHDRVEIYRPLHADPKEVRRRRAEQGKAMKKGGDPAR